MDLKIKNTAKSRIREHKLDSDLFYVVVQNESDMTDTIEKAVPRRFVQFHFCIAGQATFQFNEGRYQQFMQESSGMVLFNPEEPIPLKISLAKGTIFCSVILSLRQLHRMFASTTDLDFLGFNPKEKFYHKWELDTNSKACLNDILELRVPENLQLVYMRARILELLVLFLAQQQSNVMCPYMENEESLQKLKLAKRLLLSDLKEPKSIEELAKATEMSVYKLKDGFKKVYGNTLHGFAFDAKMQIAKEKIQTENPKIKEIASDLGYEHASHFIAAFKRKFGITPKQYALSLAN